MKKITLYIVLHFSVLAVSAQHFKSLRQLDGSRVDTSVIAARLRHIIDSAHVTGLQISVVDLGKIQWNKSVGLKDVENKTPLNDSTVMYAASLTKVVSAYLFLRLVDQGIFQLDKPIHFYLPKPIGTYAKWKELTDDTAAFNRITPRMLLAHISGLPVLRFLYNNKVNLIAKPGEKFYYSNEGLNLLGVMIEEYIGKKLETLARNEVFAPLHMDHTSMIWDSAFVSNFSYAYYKDGKKYGSERRESSRAAGSMSTTANDYAKFAIQLMQHKGLSQGLYEEFFAPQVFIKSKRGFGPLKDSLTTDNDAIKLSWGLGVGLFESPYGPAFFHTGHGEANQNYFVAFPQIGIAIVILSNSENFESVSDLVLETCIGDRFSPLRWLGHLQ